MTLYVPSAVIDSNPKKYILAKVVETTGEEQYVVRAKPHEGFTFHKDILAALRQEPHVKDATCVGGGYIAIDHERMKISAWGASTAFGAPDHAILRDVLTASFRGFTIELLP